MQIILLYILGTETAIQQQQQPMQTQASQQMIAGQQHPAGASVQFRQPLPPANLRPGMRLGLPPGGPPGQVCCFYVVSTFMDLCKRQILLLKYYYI